MFRTTCILAAALCLALFPVLLAYGGLYVETYGLAPDQGAAFVARRASPMFLGLAVLLWLSRNLPVGEARNALAFGLAVTWAGIAVTGVYEYASGTATAAILLAALFELGFAAAFLLTRRA